MKASWRVAIVGLGLIGGSLARALRQADPVCDITGIDPDPLARDLLLGEGVLNHACESLHELPPHPFEVLIIATPVQAWEQLSAAHPVLARAALVMDTGSVKAYANRCFAARPTFVAAHPIAGSEFSGAAYSTPDLFHGKRIILTPAPERSAGVVHAARAFWEGVGCHVSEMEDVLHDRIYAYVSHLPQLMAYTVALGMDAQGGLHDARLLRHLRLAGSSPALWAGIMRHNPALAMAAETCQRILGHMIGELESQPQEQTGASSPSDAAAREKVLALVPRIIASCLIGALTLEERKLGESLARYAGSGFADMTAPAMEPPEEDLARISAHSAAMVPLLRAVDDALRGLIGALSQGNWTTLEGEMMRARAAYATALQAA